jgi:hypothetical protein
MINALFYNPAIVVLSGTMHPSPFASHPELGNLFIGEELYTYQNVLNKRWNKIEEAVVQGLGSGHTFAELNQKGLEQKGKEGKMATVDDTIRMGPHWNGATNFNLKIHYRMNEMNRKANEMLPEPERKEFLPDPPVLIGPLNREDIEADSSEILGEFGADGRIRGEFFFESEGGESEEEADMIGSTRTPRSVGGTNEKVTAGHKVADGSEADDYATQLPNTTPWFQNVVGRLKQ